MTVSSYVKAMRTTVNFYCATLCMLQVVSVTFNELSLEHHAICRHDSVSLYDGSSANAPLLSRFCTVATSTITSSGSSLFVIFQTDNSTNKGRFSLSWTFGSFIISICWLTAVVEIITGTKKLDLVCRKRAVSNSRPACRKAFFEVCRITRLYARQ